MKKKSSHEFKHVKSFNKELENWILNEWMVHRLVMTPNLPVAGCFQLEREQERNTWDNEKLPSEKKMTTHQYRAEGEWARKTQLSIPFVRISLRVEEVNVDVYCFSMIQSNDRFVFFSAWLP